MKTQSTAGETAKIGRIKIVGQAVIDADSEHEAREAAQFVLDWDGDSEADTSPLQVEVSPEWDAENERESGRYEVRECWGELANRDYGDGDVVATYDTEAEADAHAAKHNAEALASVMDGKEYTLPAPIDSIYFGGCERGLYPQSRRATISATMDGEEIEVTGFGSARFLRDSHSHEALEDAVKKLIAAIAKAKGGEG